MSRSAYTLLIIESPVLAGIIQKLAPPNVYVLATGGFCWHPRYQPDKNRLTTRADPKKLEWRKELKKQAQWAAEIIIATDEDPSGDFIAWSVTRFLTSKQIKRGSLQNISRKGIAKTLAEAVPLRKKRLEEKLRNRFLTRQEWNRSNLPLSMRKAGLAVVLSGQMGYDNFMDQAGALYKSSGRIHCEAGRYLAVQKEKSPEFYIDKKPISTFDLISDFSLMVNIRFEETQNLLQQLFQTVLSTGEALISYPRTDCRAFYRDTWSTLRTQHLKSGADNELKPEFLQQTAGADTPHESIHVLNAALTPELVRGELPARITKLYSYIFQKTMDAISMPVFPVTIFKSESHPDAHFYATRKIEINELRKSLRPVVTLSDLGHQLNRLGVQRSSDFGQNLDRWIENKWIDVQNGVVAAGKSLQEFTGHSKNFRQKLETLRQISDETDLSPETVREIITS